MAKSRKKFKTEVQQLLDLVIHSLYSHKEIFLRELISNASDAIDRARFESLAGRKIKEPKGGWKVKLIPDKNAKTLTIRDNGIGMSREELEKNIGTIANSGTKAFLEELRNKDVKNNPEFIGQFGVGFYSSFMVSDKVSVLTRRAGENVPAQLWGSSGDGTYTVEETDKEECGTDIVLHLKEDQEEYLEEWKIRQIVKKYSDYVAFPIVMDVTRKESPKDEKGHTVADSDELVEYTEEGTLNSMKAIWARPKKEISEDEYNAFYKAVSHDFTDPAKVIHYAAEGAMEFNALLYIPAKAPFDLFYEMSPKGVHLYVKRVFIMNDCEGLLPAYLRFMRGVVDSSDLPLNVSREILQEDTLLKKIQKNLVNKILGTLKDLKEKEREQYETFYKEFGKVLKEGMHMDFSSRDKLKELLLFESSEGGEGKMISLKEYVDGMPKAQKEIYIITGENRDAVMNSPHLEAFREKNLDVLLLTDPIDEWVIQALPEYEEKKLKAIDRGEVDLQDKAEKKETEKEQKVAQKKYKDLLKKMEEYLKEDVSSVRLSSRLTESACCLVADDKDMNANMERIMQSMGQDIPASKRILELNPHHAVLEKMLTLYQESPNDTCLKEYSELLFGQALLTEGSIPSNPLRFTQQISKLMSE